MTSIVVYSIPDQRFLRLMEKRGSAVCVFEDYNIRQACGGASEKLALESGTVCRTLARPMVMSPLTTGATINSSRMESALTPPFIEPKGLANSLPTVFCKQELSSGGVVCHNLKASETQSNLFEVQLSETCLQRFVMFDHSGSKKRIVFHPSMVDEIPTILQSGHAWQDASVRAVGCQNETFLSSFLPAENASFDAKFPFVWRSTPLTERREALSQALKESSMQAISKGGEKRNIDCPSHENTEDLEALLWSDEEMSSTGHSPSTVGSDNSHTSSSKGSYSACSTRKRKACNEAETDSTATSLLVKKKGLSCSASNTVGRVSGYVKEDVTVFDLSFTDVMNSSRSTNDQWQYEWGTSGCEQSVKNSRKAKIQTTLHRLRCFIPGESMDTTLLLDEAIQYVKTLQVKVQKVEAKKLVLTD